LVTWHDLQLGNKPARELDHMRARQTGGNATRRQAVEHRQHDALLRDENNIEWNAHSKGMNGSTLFDEERLVRVNRGAPGEPDESIPKPLCPP
jgi:hypothetical protein